AVDVLHAQVAEHHVEQPGARGLERGAPPLRHLDVVAGVAELVGEQARHLDVIIDHQDARLRWRRAARHDVRVYTHDRPRAIGQVTTARVPAATSLWSAIWPPWFWTMWRAIARPSPVPWPRFLVVKKGSKTWCRCSMGMPQPSSMTSMRTAPSSARAAMA